MEVTKFVVSGRDKAKLYGDYSSYRTQLANRIHNLRRKLGVASKKPPAKYTNKAPVTAEDIGRNNESVGELYGLLECSNLAADSFIYCCSPPNAPGHMRCR